MEAATVCDGAPDQLFRVGLGQTPKKSGTCFLIHASKTIKACLYKPEQISQERLEGRCTVVAKILLQIKKIEMPKLERPN